jgi:hypothetical protein
MKKLLLVCPALALTLGCGAAPTNDLDFHIPQGQGPHRLSTGPAPGRPRELFVHAL